MNTMKHDSKDSGETTSPVLSPDVYETESIESPDGLQPDSEGTELYVDNIPYEVTCDELVAPLSLYAQILKIFLSKEFGGKRNRGWAIVLVANDAVQKILTATIVIRGRILRVKRKRKRQGPTE